MTTTDDNDEKPAAAATPLPPPIYRRRGGGLSIVAMKSQGRLGPKSSGGTNDDKMEKAEVKPLLILDQRPNILAITDAARSVIHSDAKEWNKGEVANLDELNSVNIGNYNNNDADDQKMDDINDAKTMAPPPPRTPRKTTGLRPGGSAAKGKKRSMTPSTESKGKVDKRLKDLNNAIVHKKAHTYSDLRTIKLRVFVRHDKVSEGRRNWEMAWELILRMKETDQYIIARKSTETGEFVEHRDDLMINDTQEFLDLCDYVEEEKSGVRYVFTIISELTLNQIREQGTPTLQYVNETGIGLRKTTIAEATACIGWLEGVGDINSQPNVERVINDFVASKLGSDTPIEVYRRQITLGSRETGGKITFKGFSVTVPKRAEKQVMNVLLRDNKFKGYANLRFHQFHRWGNMTHGELICLGRRHIANMKKLAKEFVTDFDPVESNEEDMSSPVQWFLTQKNSTNQPLFYLAEKTAKGMIVTYNQKDSSKALDFLHNIGSNASKTFVFNNTEFPSLGNSKYLGKSSHSYLSVLKHSLSKEAPHKPPAPISPTPPRTQNRQRQINSPPANNTPTPQPSAPPAQSREISSMNQIIEALERTMSGATRSLEKSAKQQEAFFERMTEMFTPSVAKLSEQLSPPATSITQESTQQSKWSDLDTITETINDQVKSAINLDLRPAFDEQVKIYEKRIKKTTSTAAKEDGGQSKYEY